MNPCLLLTVVLFPAFSMNAADKFDVAQLTPAATWKVDFVKDIQPIFAKACIYCHGPEKQKAEFRVDQRAVLLTGGDSGRAAVVAGNSKGSHLIDAVKGTHPRHENAAEKRTAHGGSDRAA